MKKMKGLKLLALLACAFMLMNFMYWRSNTVSLAYNPNNLIRLHVVANSDSGPDQELKAAVAARIRAEMINILGEEPGRILPADGAERAWTLLHRDLHRIQIALDSVLDQWGADYGGRPQLGVFPFPDRHYGDMLVPRGMYRAVHITLGQGQGQNWWCILFPPLCLVDPASGYDPVNAPSIPATLDELPELLISEDQLEDVPLEVRWAVLDLFGALDRWTAPLRHGIIQLVRRSPAPSYTNP